MPRPADTRQRLLATASTLFYEHGIGATGVDAVVRAAGVSKPTLYAQFHSKSELVAAVLEQRYAERSEELRTRIAAVADPRARPLEVFAWLAEFYERGGARGCGFLNAAAELPDPDDVARRVVEREKRWLLDFLTTLARDAGAPDPDRIASQLMLLVDGVAGRVVVSGPSAAAAAVADATLAARTLLAAAGVAPAP